MQSKILDTANRLFFKYGLRAVSIDDICRELSISKKTFYQYYSSKEDLISGSLDALEEKRVNFLIEVVSEKNAIEALIALSREVRKRLDGEPELMKKDLQKYYPNIYKTFGEKHTKSGIEFFKNNVEKGIEEGFYREDLDPDFIAIFYITQIRFAFETAYNFDKKKFTKKKLMDFFFDLYFRVVVNEKGMAYYEENYQK